MLASTFSVNVHVAMEMRVCCGEPHIFCIKIWATGLTEGRKVHDVYEKPGHSSKYNNHY